jgi:hypothetical protein
MLFVLVRVLVIELVIVLIIERLKNISEEAKNTA